jgi:hypothetical protein
MWDSDENRDRECRKCGNWDRNWRDTTECRCEAKPKSKPKPVDDRPEDAWEHWRRGWGEW